MSTRRFLAAASLLLLAACAAVPLAPIYPGVVMIDVARLQTLIETGPPQLASTDTGTLRATLAIRNRSTARLLIEGRASFAGAAGAALESPTGWQRIFIERDSGGSLQFSSLGSNARVVTIELREVGQ